MEMKVLIEAPELASAITALANAISGKDLGAFKDPTSLSDEDTVKLPNGDDPTKYTMFNDMAKAAQALKKESPKAYEKVLGTFVDVEAGKKYGAILPKDWGRATKEFKDVLASLKAGKVAKKEEAEEEEDNVAKELMYFFDEAENCVGTTKKGDEIRDDVEYISKAAYLKKKKEIEAELEATYEDVDAEDDYEEEEAEAPRLSVGELRALAAKAKNAGVSVGSVMKKIAGVTKISSIPEDKYNALEDALKEAMEG